MCVWLIALMARFFTPPVKDRAFCSTLSFWARHNQSSHWSLTCYQTGHSQRWEKFLCTGTHSLTALAPSPEPWERPWESLPGNCEEHLGGELCQHYAHYAGHPTPTRPLRASSWLEIDVWETHTVISQTEPRSVMPRWPQAYKTKIICFSPFTQTVNNQGKF